jgi:hypothetical protein
MTEVAVFDREGTRQTMAWATAKYGPFIIYPAPPPPNLPDGQADTGLAWKVTALREKNDATFIARTLSDKREPVPGIRVCFYWPDAPSLESAGPLGAPYDGVTPNRAVLGCANVNGDTGFPMGPGAHYDAARGERGPHAAWMHGTETRSDLFLGIGMIFDDHLHLDVEWSLVEDAGEEQPVTELDAILLRIAEAVERIADCIEAVAND